MSKKKLIIGGGAVAAVVGLALALFVFEVHTAFIDERVDEKIDVSSDMKLVAEGVLHEVEHKGRGKVQLYHAGDEVTVALTEFDIENGPDLRLRLVDIEDAKDSESVKKAGFVDLGPLKGNIGDQSYKLAEPFDEKKHRALVVWCERFGVNFMTAPLAPPSG